jgi:hypothetical protein
MKIVHAKTGINGKRKIYAADDNVFSDEPEFNGPNAEEDAESADAVEEDMGEDGRQDSSSIDMDNNIVNHLIAECQNCHGIFISAMLASDQDIESINGVCPLCSKDTEQALKWIIKDYPEDT